MVAKALRRSLTERWDEEREPESDPCLKSFQLLHRIVGSPLLRCGVQDDEASSIGYGRTEALFTQLYVNGKIQGYDFPGPQPETVVWIRRSKGAAWIATVTLMERMNIFTVPIVGNGGRRWKTRGELITCQVHDLKAEDAKPLLVWPNDWYTS